MTYDGRHRAERYAQFIGGPYDGRRSFVPFPSHIPTPPHICTSMGTSGWQHYGHADGNGYLYVGPCASVEHPFGMPHEHMPDNTTRCCCGDPNCREGQYDGGRLDD